MTFLPLFFLGIFSVVSFLARTLSGIRIFKGSNELRAAKQIFSYVLHVNHTFTSVLYFSPQIQLTLF